MIPASPIIIFVLTLLLGSCNFRKEPENLDFRSDCFVYESEVETERYAFGKVAFIDTSKASGCAKTQLKDVYLLYYDTICVTVYKEHPRININIIEEFIKKYQTDSTRLTGFVKFDSSLTITVSRLCKDSSDQYHYGSM